MKKHSSQSSGVSKKLQNHVDDYNAQAGLKPFEALETTRLYRIRIAEDQFDTLVKLTRSILCEPSHSPEEILKKRIFSQFRFQIDAILAVKSR